jgi:DNA-binding NarL/FixJ family response regulator
VTEPSIRVVLADDHPVVREGLSALLSSVPSVTVAGMAGDGQQAVQAAVTLRPDVLVMDIQMPGLSGIAAAAEISRLAPEVAVLMLTMFDDDDSVFAAMRAGARGYVLKGAQQQEIIRAIQATAAGEAIFGPGIARLVLGFFAGPPAPGIPFPDLTSREREVLDLIATGARNTEIARRMSIAPKTVANHISAIFAKLRVADRGQAIIQACACSTAAARHRPAVAPPPGHPQMDPPAPDRTAASRHPVLGGLIHEFERAAEKPRPE